MTLVNRLQFTHFFKFILLIPFMISFSAGCVSSSKKNQDIASIKMQMGISEIEKNNLPSALTFLLEAEELNANDQHIQNNLGLVYYLRKKFDLAIVHFSRAISINGKFTEAKNNLARVYIEDKQFQKAERLLEVVVEDLTYNNYVAAYSSLGLVKFNLKKYSEALTFFSKAIEGNREDCFSQLYLGRSLLELKKNSMAASRLDLATYYCRLSKIDEAHYFSAIAYYRLGRVDLSLGRFQEVIKLFENGKHKESAKQMIGLIEKDLK